jgi:hypothetical protein
MKRRRAPRDKTVRTVEISNWAELLEEVYRGTWDPGIGRYRSQCVFRGLGTPEFGLLTGLKRLAPRTDDARRLERHLLRNFRKYAIAELPGTASDWRWLPFAQHHGLPTRLLDWTFSPLVALHFATQNSDYYDRDGVVWCMSHQQSNGFLPDRLRTILRQEGADVFTAEMLDGVAPGLDEFDKLAEAPFVLFLEPPSLDMRIANQFALFSLMSSPNASLPEWLESHSDAAREIVIPRGAKQEIRDKLDQAGITERFIYPGADGIARWLTRYYRPAHGPDPPRDVSPAPSDQCEIVR